MSAVAGQGDSFKFPLLEFALERRRLLYTISIYGEYEILDNGEKSIAMNSSQSYDSGASKRSVF